MAVFTENAIVVVGHVRFFEDEARWLVAVADEMRTLV